jgi:arylformamidase
VPASLVLIDITRYNIIDLSKKVDPALLKADGEYFHGSSDVGRMIYLKEFFLSGWKKEVRMHFIEGESHTGTHVETPYKVLADGRDIVSMPLDSFIGEAVLVDVGTKKAGEQITVADMENAGVKEGDRVLVRGPQPALPLLPYLSEEACKWLISKKTKLLAMQYSMMYHPDQVAGKEITGWRNDNELFKAGVVRIDGIVNLEKITKRRFFLIALPLNFKRLEASWTRAIALEERD